VKTERNLMTRPSREGRLRKPALPPGRWGKASGERFEAAAMANGTAILPEVL
jgi:hypothetical protein